MVDENKDFGPMREDASASAPQPVEQASPEPPRPEPTQQDYYKAPAPQPMPVEPYVEADSSLTLGSWVLNTFLTMIPLVGLIMLIVWGFSSSTAPAKKNWARALLIWQVVGIVLCILFSGMIIAMIAAIGGTSGTSYSAYR